MPDGEKNSFKQLIYVVLKKRRMKSEGANGQTYYNTIYANVC